MSNRVETLNAKQLAKRLHMSHQRVSRGIDAGELPGIRVGHRFFIPVTWVEEWEKSGKLPDQAKRHGYTTSPYIRRAS